MCVVLAGLLFEQSDIEVLSLAVRTLTRTARSVLAWHAQAPAAPVPTDPDGIVEHCLLAGLLAVADEELPIMLSDFYSKHMLANKPDGEFTHACVARLLSWVSVSCPHQ